MNVYCVLCSYFNLTRLSTIEMSTVCLKSVLAIACSHSWWLSSVPSSYIQMEMC